MKKQLTISILLLICSITISAQVTAPVAVDNTPPKMKTDTVIDGSKIFLTRTFYFGKDTLVIETAYRYNPKDFSFYYQELEERTLISLNKVIVNQINKNHIPQVHSFNLPIGERITANAVDYLVILGNEFYCNDTDCKNLFAIVINTSTMQVLDINTGFCDAKELLKLINKRSKENDNVQIPVINDCKTNSASEATWINVDKAL